MPGASEDNKEARAAGDSEQRDSPQRRDQEPWSPQQ